jgi:hypothetical protein
MLDEVAAGLTVSLGQSAAFAAAAVALWFYLLRWLDVRAGISDFAEVLNVLKQDPRALARYLGMRSLAVAFLVATVLATVRF